MGSEMCIRDSYIYIYISAACSGTFYQHGHLLSTAPVRFRMDKIPFCPLKIPMGSNTTLYHAISSQSLKLRAPTPNNASRKPRPSPVAVRRTRTQPVINEYRRKHTNCYDTKYQVLTLCTIYVIQHHGGRLLPALLLRSISSLAR